MKKIDISQAPLSIYSGNLIYEDIYRKIEDVINDKTNLQIRYSIFYDKECLSGYYIKNLKQINIEIYQKETKWFIFKTENKLDNKKLYIRYLNKHYLLFFQEKIYVIPTLEELSQILTIIDFSKIEEFDETYIKAKWREIQINSILD